MVKRGRLGDIEAVTMPGFAHTLMDENMTYFHTGKTSAPVFLQM